MNRKSAMRLLYLQKPRSLRNCMGGSISRDGFYLQTSVEYFQKLENLLIPSTSVLSITVTYLEYITCCGVVDESRR